MAAIRPTWLMFSPVFFLVLWSTGYVAAKFGLGYIEPLTFLTLRFACVVNRYQTSLLLIHPPTETLMAVVRMMVRRGQHHGNKRSFNVPAPLDLQNIL